MIEEYNFESDKKKKFDEGGQAKALAIVENMLAKGFDLETIAELTGLNHSEIEHLQHNEA